MENLSSVKSIVETVTSCLDAKERAKDAILSFVVRRNAFVELPTGYRKTICYCCLLMIYNQLKGRMGFIAVIIYSLA